jgi:hypothetical protein
MSALESAFIDGASVTAKVLWMPKSANIREQGRPRYIRCTPLLGADDRVGVWMIILVPLEEVALGAKSYESVGGVNGGLRGRMLREKDGLDGMFLDDMSVNGTTFAERRSTIAHDRDSSSTPVPPDRAPTYTYSQENLQQLRNGAGTPVSMQRSQSRAASLRMKSSVDSDIDGVLGLRSSLNSHPHSSANIYGSISKSENAHRGYNTFGRLTTDGRVQQQKRNIVVDGNGNKDAWKDEDAEVGQMYAEHLRGSTPSTGKRTEESRSTPSQGSSDDYAYVDEAEKDSPVMGNRGIGGRGRGLTPTPPRVLRADHVEVRKLD